MNTLLKGGGGAHGGGDAADGFSIGVGWTSALLAYRDAKNQCEELNKKSKCKKNCPKSCSFVIIGTKVDEYAPERWHLYSATFVCANCNTQKQRDSNAGAYAVDGLWNNIHGGDYLNPKKFIQLQPKDGCVEF